MQKFVQHTFIVAISLFLGSACVVTRGFHSSSSFSPGVDLPCAATAELPLAQREKMLQEHITRGKHAARKARRAPQSHRPQRGHTLFHVSHSHQALTSPASYLCDALLRSPDSPGSFQYRPTALQLVKNPLPFLRGAQALIEVQLPSPPTPNPKSVAELRPHDGVLRGLASVSARPLHQTSIQLSGLPLQARFGSSSDVFVRYHNHLHLLAKVSGYRGRSLHQKVWSRRDAQDVKNSAVSDELLWDLMFYELELHFQEAEPAQKCPLPRPCATALEEFVHRGWPSLADEVSYLENSVGALLKGSLVAAGLLHDSKPPRSLRELTHRLQTELDQKLSIADALRTLQQALVVLSQEELAPPQQNGQARSPILELTRQSARAVE